MSRILVAEDEPRIASFVAKGLAASGLVPEVAGDGATALALALTGEFDLLVLDIGLPGMDGFEVLKALPDVPPFVVFATAYDEYAIRAFEVNALDYLLKPVTAERLSAALQRVRPAPAGRAPRLRDDDLVQLKTDTGSHFVPVRSITCIHAELNYTLVQLASGMRHLVRRSLQSWAEQLDPDAFVRVSREALVNFAHVTQHEGDGHKCGLLRLDGRKEPVPVSRRHWPLVRARLQRD